MSKFMITCHEATYLHEKKKEGKLGIVERVSLWVHLFSCSLCRLFFKQADLLQNQVAQLAQDSTKKITLSTERKGEIQKGIEQELKRG